MLLNAKDVQVRFRKENQKKLFGREYQQVLRGVSLQLEKGECLGIVGESGSGKSTLGRVLCGLLPPNHGSIKLDDIELYSRHKREEREQLRHKVSIVFQDYTSSVNPRFRVRDIIGESLRAKKINLAKAEYRKKIIELLEQVGLDDSYINRYPHELSGGQLQRVCIARAVALEPEILLLDEAVSSLDASTQVQVMDLLAKLRKTYNFSYLFITHDLTAVTYLCDRVLFLNDGNVVEEVQDINDLGKVKHSYAKKLLKSVLKPEIESRQERVG